MILNKLSTYFKPSRLVIFCLRRLLFFLLGCFIGAIVIFLALTVGVILVTKKYDRQVYPNVFVGKTDVSGKTISQLKELLDEEEKRILAKKLVFLWRNNGERRWEVIPARIDFKLEKEATIKKVFAAGRKKSGLANYFEIYKLLLVPFRVEINSSFDELQLAALTAQMAAEVDRPVQEGLFEFKEGRVVSFQAAKEGREVVRSEVKSLVVSNFSKGGEEVETIVDLPIKVLPPVVTTDATNDLGIKELLAAGESSFKDSIPSRVHNIGLASMTFHGIVIPPGETFSFAEKIGTISAETGYQKAYVIKKNETVLEDGGGVCQVSTTLFRAAIYAGLPIVERSPHYYRVGFYEQGGYPPGMDATVYPPSPDLKFLNDTPAYILVQTKIDKAKKKLTFEFYGTNDGRKAEVEKPKIYSTTAPPPPTYVDDPELPIGVVKRVDLAHWGAKVSFTRKVYWDNEELKEEKTFWSNYVPWPEVYRRGTKP